MIIINNINNLYKHWKRTHKQFVKWGRVPFNSFAEAQESFVHFLEIRDISVFEVELYLPQLNYKENYWCTAFPLILGLTLNSCQSYLDLNDKVVFYMWMGLIVAFLLSFPMIGLINRCYRQMSSANATFLQMALQKYIDKTSWNRDFKAKLVPLRGGLPALIPTDSEYIYDDLMPSSQYYWNAWKIVLSENSDDYCYVFFTNRYYSNNEGELLQNFVNQCASQLGKQWQIETLKVQTEQLKTVGVLDI